MPLRIRPLPAVSRFPAQALPLCFLEVGVTLAFGHLSAETGLLHALGELVLRRESGHVVGDHSVNKDEQWGVSAHSPAR
ncbi:hypothetical protein ABT224_15525 [Streptomyces sp. NPDC001584]|uniref:hypothetical protein n=1 Tax=Streptomyces sp. NPDC001584 TaxID=3154521 RepID=UPI0033345663